MGRKTKFTPARRFKLDKQTSALYVAEVTKMYNMSTFTPGATNGHTIHEAPGLRLDVWPSTGTVSVQAISEGLQDEVVDVLYDKFNVTSSQVG